VTLLNPPTLLDHPLPRRADSVLLIGWPGIQVRHASPSRPRGQPAEVLCLSRCTIGAGDVVDDVALDDHGENDQSPPVAHCVAVGCSATARSLAHW